MRHIALKTAFMRLSAALLLIIGTISASAQYYLNVFQKNGTKVEYVIADLDSISITQKTVPSTTHEYVDLGLSVMWATVNVGATNPEDYGDYFAWGETEPYYEAGYAQSGNPVWKQGKSDGYGWLSYRYGSNYDQLTKYCYDSDFGYNGYTDILTTLLPDDDVAHVNWGGNWRMPTDSENYELVTSCTWTWTTQNGVNGYLVTSNKSGYEGRSIFLPAAGYRYGTSLYSAGSYGIYLSSSLRSDFPFCARWFSFYSGVLYAVFSDDGLSTDRNVGGTVRPVCPNEEWQGITSMELNKNNISLLQHGTYNLGVTLLNGTEDCSFLADGVSFDSSNTAVATVNTVNGKGLVTGVSAGTATITATYKKLTAVCEVTVTAFETEGNENGFDYVDLGLSVKWATCNVGAESMTGYGDYFAWGETEPYYYFVNTYTQHVWWKADGYTWSNYKYSDGSYNTLTKYCNDIQYGYNDFTDNKSVLDTEDDVAHVKWGGDWRMPTESEFGELIDNCTWTWSTYSGVNGYLITSNVLGFTDRSIFLPAAGYCNNTNLYGVGDGGYYWSSMLCTDSPYLSYGVNLLAGMVGWNYNWVTDNRYFGNTVRPVLPKAVEPAPQ